jgi:hypothetical protein
VPQAKEAQTLRLVHTSEKLAVMLVLGLLLASCAVVSVGNVPTVKANPDTFGNTAVPPDYDSWDEITGQGWFSDFAIVGSQFTCPSNGTADSITAWFYVYYYAQMGAAIYRYSDGALIGTTDLIDVYNYEGFVQRTLDFSGTKPTLVADTVYVLVVWANAQDQVLFGYTDSNGPVLCDYYYTGYGYWWDWPDPIEWSGETTCEYAIYCTYTPVTSGPGQPTLTSPSDSTTVYQPTVIGFTWTPGLNATSQRIIVDNDSNCLSPIDNVLFSDNTTTSWYKVMVSSGTYYWKVMAINAAGENSSAIRSFTTTPISPVPAWWDTSWSKRQAIVVWPRNPENYQVKITIPYDGDMKSDYGDLRFLENSDAGIMPYWKENYTVDNATFWIRRTENYDNVVYAYYGNASATTIENGDNTFPFFDDFLGDNLDGGKWKVNTETYTDGTVSVSGGILSLSSANPFVATDVVSRQTWNRNVAMRSKENIGGGIFNSSSGFRDGGGVPIVEVIANLQTAGQMAGRCYVTGAAYSPDIGAVNINRTYEMSWITNEAKFWANNSFIGTVTSQISTSASPVEFYADSYGGYVYADWVFVRSYASPDSTATLGSEESAPSAGGPTVVYLPRILMSFESAPVQSPQPARPSVKVFGTIYSRAENGQTWCMVLDNLGDPVNTASVCVTIWRENGENYKGGAMTYITSSNGVYTYDFTVPSQYGIYLCDVRAIWATDNAYGACEFQVSPTFENINTIKTTTDNIQTGLNVLTGKVDNVQTGVNSIKGVADNMQTGINSLRGVADNIQGGANSIISKCDNMQVGVNAIKGVSDNIQLGLNALRAVTDNSQTGINTIIANLTTTYDMLVTVRDNAVYIRSQADNIKSGLDNVQVGVNISLSDLVLVYNNTATIISDCDTIIAQCNYIENYLENTIYCYLTDNIWTKLNAMGAAVAVAMVPSPWVKDTENCTVYCQIENAGVPLTGENVKLSIWQRDNTLFIENVIMEHLVRGIYQYQLTSPAQEGHYGIDIWTDNGIYASGTLQVIDPPAGPQGPAGSTGSTGPTGPTGPQGPQGENGTGQDNAARASAAEANSMAFVALGIGATFGILALGLARRRHQNL